MVWVVEVRNLQLRTDGSTMSTERSHTERRYNEQEIADIFRKASSAQKKSEHGSETEGLTLAEIEQIGIEAGLSPELIASAAASLDKSVVKPETVTCLGIPISVGRTVTLASELTDNQWRRLVSDLHDTFGITGRTSENGMMRIWEGENMEVVVEPAGTGHRIRIKRLHENLRNGLYGGSIFIAMGLFFLMIVAAKGDFFTFKSIAVSMFALAGSGALGVSAFQLDQWRKDQENRLDGIVSRISNQPGNLSADEKAIQQTRESGERLDLDEAPTGERIGSENMQTDISRRQRI